MLTVVCCYSIASEAAEDLKPVIRTGNRRRKQKRRSPIEYDDDSSDMLEPTESVVAEPAVVSRCLRSRDSLAKKRRGSSDIDDDKKDNGHESETVSRHKRRKSQRR